MFRWWQEAKLTGEKRDFEDFYTQGQKWIRSLIDEQIAKLKGY